MKSITLKAFVTLLVVGVAAFGLAGTAGAAHVIVDLSVPDQPAIGQPKEIRADFHSEDDGAPIAGITVVFHEEVTFGGVTSDVVLGQAVTDSNGSAVLTYEPRTAGTHEIHARYSYGDAEEEDAAASLTVPAGQQLVHSTAGVKIPGLNVWLLMAVVAAVWAILLSVAFRVIAIAHADEAPTMDRAGSVGSR